MKIRIDITGQTFGKWKVLSYYDTRNKKALWKCICECGTERVVQGTNLRNGMSTSCGCSRNKEKKKIDNRVYRIWKGMKERCNDPNNTIYYNMEIWNPWYKSFECFEYWMGEPPDDKSSIDRINTLKGYFPWNCRWATSTIQNRNSTSAKYWYVNGQQFESASDAGSFFGVNRKTIKRWCDGSNDSRGYSYPPRENCWSELKYN